MKNSFPPLPVRILVILIVLGTIGYFGFRSLSPADDGQLKASGTIEAVVVNISPEVAGKVSEVLAVEGHAQCGDGFEGFKAIQQHQPDLVFLDIQMPKINGFEMLELLEQPPAIIFTTAFDEYAIKAFEAHAIDYLLKPFSQERFDKAIGKWKEQQCPQPNQIQQRCWKPQHNLLCRKIVWW